MKDLLTLIFHLLTLIARIPGAVGSRAIIAENLLLKQQLLVHVRPRQRAPNLPVRDRALFGLWTLFMNPRHIARSAIIIKPSTPLRFHRALKNRKYRLLYSARYPGKPGPNNDPLFQYHQWQGNLRIPEVNEIKSIPHVPLSHPFVERLIGSIRRELLDYTFFWTATDLQNKLKDYQCYFNEYRIHSGRDGVTPVESADGKVVNISDYRWKKHCRGLFQLPVAA